MELSEQIIQVLDYICEKIGVIIDWTDQNIIPKVETICQHVVNYKLVSSISWLIITFIITVISIMITRKFIEKDIDDFEIIFGYMISGCLLFVLIGGGGIWINTIIKCLTFPELVCYEYFTDILEAMK